MIETAARPLSAPELLNTPEQLELPEKLETERMSKLDILVAPDPRLKVTSRQAVPDKVDDDSIRRLMDDMLETMYAAPGIGLAAPQVGKALRVIVVDLADKDEEPRPYRMVNPKIVDASEELRVTNEGCLSVPDFYADVERADSDHGGISGRDRRPEDT